MKAVNLIPADLRSANSGAPGRTGAAVYVVLGALGVLVILATTWALTTRQAAGKRADVAEARMEADRLEARAGALEPYARFGEISRKRVETVTSLSRNRFNWPHALREISRVTPENVWFSQLRGTVAPKVSVPDVTVADTGAVRSALSVPAIEIEGCSTSQSDVARYMTQLRRVEGVTRVSLAASVKNDGAGLAAAPAPGGSSGGDGDCRGGSGRKPKFGMVVFFERSTATPSTAEGGASAAAAAPTDASEEDEDK